MASFTQVDSPQWLTTEFALATLTVRVDELGARLGFRVETWEEDGLGPARGAALRLTSGRPIVLQELQHTIEMGSATGPVVWVDAQDLANVGVERMKAEILAALDLPNDAVDWVQDGSVAEEAARQAKWAREYRDARQRGVPLPEFPTS